METFGATRELLYFSVTQQNILAYFHMEWTCKLPYSKYEILDSVTNSG
jgi:hypothetical protein